MDAILQVEQRSDLIYGNYIQVWILKPEVLTTCKLNDWPPPTSAEHPPQRIFTRELSCNKYFITIKVKLKIA